MSYDIVRGIKIENGGVHIKASSSNVSPKTYRWEEWSWATRILQEQGKEALDVEILKGYESGNLQGGGKYGQALERLRHNPTYIPFSWRDNWEGYKEERENRADEWEALLRWALTSKTPKEKYTITKVHYGKRKRKKYMRK